MKAFAITENDENTGGIYFADHDITAKKAFCREFDHELTDVTCRRAPWADQFAGRAVPAKVMIDAGWHFECCECGERIDTDYLRENRLPLDQVIGTQWSLVFCGKRCAARFYSMKRRRAEQGAQAIACLAKIIRKRFPDSEIIISDDQHKPHAYITNKHGMKLWFWDQVAVSFTFPGMKIGPATLRLDHFNSSKIGPQQPEYQCCRGDLEAFEAYADQTRIAA